MIEWKTFNPKETDFDKKADYIKHRNSCRCGICHKKLEPGDKFDLRAVQYDNEVKDGNLIAVIVHKKCLEEE